MSRWCVLLVGLLFPTTVTGQEKDEFTKLQNRVRQLEAENKALKDQLSQFQATRREQFRRLLAEYASERDDRKLSQLQHEMALTSGQPEGLLRRGSTDSRMAAEYTYLQAAVQEFLTRKDTAQLVEMAEGAPLVPVRNHAIQFLLWLDAKDSLPALRRLTKDANDSVRRNAVRAVEVLTTGHPNKQL